MDRLDRGPVIAAGSLDGIAEAVTVASAVRRSVQSHPELLTESPRQRALLEMFCTQAVWPSQDR
jgi:gamma-glutamyl-gamma-aminobutyrate hydrolase PuuD